MRGRLRKRFSPLCGVVDGSAAICSSSPTLDSLLKSLADAVPPPPLLADACSLSVELLPACSAAAADGAGDFASGDKRLRGDSS